MKEHLHNEQVFGLMFRFLNFCLDYWSIDPLGLFVGKSASFATTASSARREASAALYENRTRFIK